MGSGSSRVIRFGVFEVNLTTGELRKNGSRVKLQDQPFQVLVSLLGRPGEIITKEELKEKLWADDTFVDFDHSLSTAINKIRQALGDSATDPRFVETVPRRGYRFICPAGWPTHPAVKPNATGTRGPNISSETPASKFDRKMLLALSVVLSLGFAAALMIWSGKPEAVPANFRGQAPAPVPLTSYPGIERSPTFSPDGNQVAFSWNGGGQDNFDIYVQLVGTLNPRRLTDDPRPDYCPAWSPDGRGIAFLRHLDTGRYGVMVISPLGGPERQVAETSGWLLRPYMQHQLSWTPDSQWLIASDKSSPEDPFGLVLISVESGQKRQLTSPPAGDWGDFEAALSPDRHSLVFRRTTNTPASGDLFLADLGLGYAVEGEPRQITFTPTWTKQPVWTPSGEAIVFIDDLALWKMHPRQVDKPQRLPFSGAQVLTPTFSTQGNRFAYQQVVRRFDIWRVDPVASGGQAAITLSPVSSTSSDMNPVYSPDGRRLVYQSNRSGSFEIWASNTDGSDTVQLTRFGGPEAGSPAWSPDGKQVAFASVASGDWNVYVVNSDGGQPRRLTTSPALDASPDWSHDGEWIYFTSDRSGEMQIWKIPVKDGKAVQVTRQGGATAIESPDGEFLYYLKKRRPSESLWRMPLRGGAEHRVLESISQSGFAVVKDGVYFMLKSPGEEQVVLHFFDFATSSSRPVIPLGASVYFWLAASPDGRSVLFSRLDETSDLMMVDNFE